MPREQARRGTTAPRSPSTAAGDNPADCLPRNLRGQRRSGTLVQYPAPRRRRHHPVVKAFGDAITNRGGGKTMKQRIAVLLMLGLVPWAGLHAQSQTAQTTFK